MEKPIEEPKKTKSLDNIREIDRDVQATSIAVIVEESKPVSIKQKPVENRLSGVQSLFSTEVFSDILFDRAEIQNKVSSELDLIMFVMRGRKVARHFFGFLTLNEILEFFTASKYKILGGRSINGLFQSLVKMALQDRISRFFNFEGDMLRSWFLKDSAFLRSSVSKSYLLQFWGLFLNFDLNDCTQEYNSCLQLKYRDEGMLDRDTTRTFLEIFDTTEKQRAVRDTIKALGVAIPSLGYMQGMNSVVGALIIFFSQKCNLKIGPETKTVQILIFTLLKFVLIKRSFSLIYQQGLYGFKLICMQIRMWLGAYHPSLSATLVLGTNEGRDGLRLQPGAVEVGAEHVHDGVPIRVHRLHPEPCAARGPVDSDQALCGHARPLGRPGSHSLRRSTPEWTPTTSICSSTSATTPKISTQPTSLLFLIVINSISGSSCRSRSTSNSKKLRFSTSIRSA